jgi:peptide/nickel transport system substrate-binding protein
VSLRRAVAHAIDYDRLNRLRNDDVVPVSNGPFPPGTDGHLENTGFPRFDLVRARQLVTAYENAARGPLTVSLASTSDTDTVATTTVIQRMLAEAEIDVTLVTTDQATLISDVLRGNFDMAFFRGFQGCDPDEQYVWWYTDSPTNLARTTDSELARFLDDGRSTPDRANRREIYEALNRRLAETVWGVWLWWPVWAVATLPTVHGAFGPPLPDGSSPFTGLAAAHPVLGLWLD